VVTFNAGDSLAVIAGAASDDRFGAAVLSLPEPWHYAGGGAVVSATSTESGAGAVYLWADPTTLLGSTSATDADWSFTNPEPDSYLGLSLASCGDDDNPWLAAGAPGAGSGAGVVLLFDTSAMSTSPGASLAGPASGAAGTELLSGHDLDGDGIADLVAAAPSDSTYADHAGTIAIFSLAGALPSSMSWADADALLTSSYAYGGLTVSEPGDVDGDGLADLAVHRDVSDPYDGAGLLLTGIQHAGVYDVDDAAVQRVLGELVLISDEDHDGADELYAVQGGIDRYVLPLANASTTPEDSADARIMFTEGDGFIHTLLPESRYIGQHYRLTAAAPYEPAESLSGTVYLPQTRWTGTAAFADVDLKVLGEHPGDMAGFGLAWSADLNGDAATELLVGAPGSDRGGAESGALFVVPGPRE